VSDGPDFNHFVQHHQLDVYQQSMARQGYAYGVDLRRSRWLASSTVGNALVRAVDRAWPKLAEQLMSEHLLDARQAPLGLLRELASFMNLLRAPLPTVRLLRPEQRGRWPLVTPLGATRGGANWLILDAEALAAVAADQRAFLLGAGLGHLHCDHAVFFSAHLLADHHEGAPDLASRRFAADLQIRALRSAMSPWTKLMTFSADRAGLLACGRLETAVAVIENPPIPVGLGVGRESNWSWLPPTPTPAQRIQALEEFARSAVFARVTARRARQRELARHVTLIDPPGAEAAESGEPENLHVPADAWSLARVDARLTARLNLI
jgi:hypothetical protein